jgi:hypothetical protein
VFGVKSASNVVRGRVGRCPDGGVQMFSGGEYRFALVLRWGTKELKEVHNWLCRLWSCGAGT